MTHELQATIDMAWDNRAKLDPTNAPELRAAVERVIADLNKGLVTHEKDLKDRLAALARLQSDVEKSTADVAEVNAAVTDAAEERRIFCVRAEDATQATAWTPAENRRHSPCRSARADAPLAVSSYSRRRRPACSAQ
mgnify:CR=1 FL=1